MDEADTQVQDALRSAIGEATAAGKSLRSLAKESKVNISSVVMFVNGKKDLKLSSAGRLARALGLKLVPTKSSGTKKTVRRAVVSG